MSFWVGFILGIVATVWLLYYSLRKFHLKIAHESAIMSKSKSVRFGEWLRGK